MNKRRGSGQSSRRTIAVVTGSRAEFGLLAPVMRAIDGKRGLDLRVIVAGAHLVSGTWRDVAASGFEVEARVAMQTRNRTGRRADAMATGRGVSGFAAVFERLRPDVVMVLGDRIEAFAAASAASIGGHRLAHIHGGDRAEGVADEAMRHAITKLAHLHYCATAASRRRLIRMGEDPANVFRVGSPAVDGLADVAPAANAPDVIVLHHPIGAPDEEERTTMRRVLAATASFGDRRLVLAPNADAGCMGIRAALRGAKIQPVEHLPRPRWLSLLAGAKVIVGNSSAGLIEAAALRTACVNIGPRQAGRERPRNVIDCTDDARAIAAALRAALALDLRRMRHPYGDGRAGPRIADSLAAIDLRSVTIRKRNTY